MKKILLAMLFISAFSFQSCSKDEQETVVVEPPVVIPTEQRVTGAITANTTWTADRIWVLDKKVVVGDGITLTIQPGTIIKGTPGVGEVCSALIIARGGKINAEGTADKPIIFTAYSDNIKLGEKAGTNLLARDNSLWGGLLILGKAKCSFKSDVPELQIEGIAASDKFGLYGGSDDADNSGVLKYVSIRHGGSEIGAGNEINGLTLGGVGSGTVIENVEVFATFDDGIEYFGGSVNTKNVLVYAFGDDGLDIDQSYKGTVSNGMVIRAATGDSGLEIDGPEGSMNAEYTLDKITIVGSTDNINKIAEFKAKARGNNKNIYVRDYNAASKVQISDNDSNNNFLAATPSLTFSSWNVKASSISGLFVLAPAVTTANTFTTAAFAKAVTTPETGVGADASVFAWTYAKIRGVL
jgi:hypothetical protein